MFHVFVQVVLLTHDSFPNLECWISRKVMWLRGPISRPMQSRRIARSLNVFSLLADFDAARATEGRLICCWKVETTPF